MAYYNQHALYHDATNHPRPSFAPPQHDQQPFYPDALPRALPPHQQQLSPSHAAVHHPPGQQQLAGQAYPAMAMPPPSTMGPSMTGGTMQMGMSQRPPPSAYQQPPLSHNPQPSSAYIPSPANYSAPQSTQSYYPQTAPRIPSPTHSHRPSSTPPQNPARPSMASAMAPNPSPQSVPQQQQQQQQQQAQTQHRPQSSMSQKPILQPPLSPASANLEAQRVTILLDINRVLLQEIVQLQAAGRAGPPPPPPATPPKPDQASPTETDGDVATKEDGGANAGGDGSATKAKAWVQSQEYIQCMRRLQSNLAYIAYVADRVHKPADQIPRHPAIMDAPAVPGGTLTEDGAHDLRSLYAELAQLYPEYVKALKEKEGSATTTPTGVVGQAQLGT